MKRWLQMTLVALALIWPASALANMAYKLRVDGLSCPFCAYGVEKQLGALDGVKRLETHIRDGTVIVFMKDGATLDEAALRRAVEKAGFTFKGFERVPTAGK